MKLDSGTILYKPILKAFFGKIQNGGLKVRYWDGEEVSYGNTETDLKIIFNQCPTSFNLEDPTLTWGELYMDGIADYEGRLEDLMRLFQNNKLLAPSVATKVLKKVVKAIDRKQAQNNIAHHYDLGNDFFSLWLDETMSYSCGYFKNETDTLYQAQLQKIDHILKKLNLKPGEKLLDIGSGWGWLIIKAAQIYGVNAMGITLSTEQYQKTRERIADLGLTKQVDVQLVNYLDLDESKYQFDKIVSVGMFEHVGQENIPKYLEKVSKLLVPGGLSLLHTITESVEDRPQNNWTKKYIFPGGYVPSLREIIWKLPDYNFYLIHVESLRMHYAMTLDKWYENFVKQLDVVREKFDERFIRMWSLYLLGAAANFRISGLHIHQLLFSKGLNNDLPLTYEYVYK